MYFLSRLLQPVRILWMTITGPFRAVVYNVRSFTPFGGLRMFVQSIGNQLGYLARLPGHYLGLNVPGARGRGFRPREAIRDWWNSMPGRESRRRIKAGKRAQFSQIHLVNHKDGARTVLHIGTVIGRSQADITFENPARKPVYLRFSHVDPQEHGAPIRLTYVAGDAPLEVNGQPVEQDALIQDDSAIKVAGDTYTCELYAWDKTPVVTRVDAGWATTVGPVRQINEDAIGIYQHKDAYLFAIADGVGGGQDGDLLSEFSIQYLLAVFHKNVPFKLNWADIFTKVFQYINAEARYFARRSPYPAGTTLTAVVIKNWEAHIAHVGDSRLYLLHNGVFRQVTVDHSKRVEVELETRHANEATEPPPMRDVLVKAIGKNDTIEPDVFSIPLQPGDRLLLCTDGLTNVVPIENLAHIVSMTRAEPAARHLIQLANDREASDNVSAVVIDVMPDPYLEDIWQARAGERVYVGYDRAWPLKLRKPGEPITEHPAARRAGCAAFLVGILLIGVVLWVLSGRGGDQTTSAALPATDTLAFTATAVPATSTPVGAQGLAPLQTSTDTIMPIPAVTATPFPTQTPAPTVELKPTSTLRPPSI